jgi:hypothetical protein
MRLMDAALMEAWELGMTDAGYTDADFDRAEELLPTLVEAGFVATDGDWTWWFTPEGVARAEELSTARASCGR